MRSQYRSALTGPASVSGGSWRGLVVDEGAVGGAAAAGRGPGADDAEDAHVVLQGRDARLGRVADHLADGVDLAVALRAFAEHDVRVLALRDGAGAERQRGHVQLEAVRLDALAQLDQA